VLVQECVRSTDGEMRDGPAGSGSPWSCKINSRARQSPPPAESPAITILLGSL
jgi:hypothetical protein